MCRAAIIGVLCAAAVAAASAGATKADWEACLQSALCRKAYQQGDTGKGDRATFDAMYRLGSADAENESGAVTQLLARVAHLGSICRRNEVFVDGRCICPDHDNGCGDVTPFNNYVIYAACAFSTAALVAHVVSSLSQSSAQPIKKQQQAATGGVKLGIIIGRKP